MTDKHLQILSKVITEKELTKEECFILSQKLDSILRKASENRVELLFLKRLKTGYVDLFKKHNISEAYKNGKAKNLLLCKTAAFFQKYLKDIKYVVIKTCYPFPVIVSDIDILFFDKNGYSSFVERLAKEGFDYIKDDELKGSLQKSGFMKCEPHKDISWHGLRFVSKDFIKKNLTKKRVGQSALIVPNNRAAFVISAAHILFDCQYLSLRDYNFLKKFLKNKNILKACIDEANKFGWNLGAEYFIDILFSGEKLTFPFWIPIIKEYAFFKSKFSFDFTKGRENQFTVKSILLPFIFYYWKRIRSKFSNAIYRNSWLY